MDQPIYFTKDHNTKEFIQTEISTVMQYYGLSDFDRTGVLEVLKRLHNNVVPEESTIDFFFQDRNPRITLPEVMDSIFRVPIPNVKVQPNKILPAELIQVAPLMVPAYKNVRYDDTDFVTDKAGMLKKSFKALIGRSSHIRYCTVNSSFFVEYESQSREKIRKQVDIGSITEIKFYDDEKFGSSFSISSPEGEISLHADESICKEWMGTIATFCLLNMVSTNNLDSERMKMLVEAGANVNASYGRTDPKPVLYYLLKHNHYSEAEWLIQHGASINAILRWEFIIEEKLIDILKLLDIMNRLCADSNGCNFAQKSDDGFNMTILHYLCYYGHVQQVNDLCQLTNGQALVNAYTYYNDSPLTIALLSPKTTIETKVALARVLYVNSNLTQCNNSSQNPVQLTMLIGQVGLVFQMLLHANNVRFDIYNHSILHLAIKTGMPTVARYILRYNNFGNIDHLDKGKDSILTLAIKAGLEDLACEIIQGDSDPRKTPATWNMNDSERDNALHQALKRGMQTLAITIWSHHNVFLDKDTTGNLPIHLALQYQLDQCVQYLVQDARASTFINECNVHDHDTPLHLALKLGYCEHSLLLLQYGANVNATNNKGLTPCHILVMVARGEFSTMAKVVMTPEQIIAIMQSLLEHNPDLEILSGDASSSNRESCVHMAIRGGAVTQQIAEMCLTYDKKLFASRDSQSATPLLLSVQQHNLHLVQLLVEESEKNVMNCEHDTPLHIAVRNGDVAIVQELISHGAYGRIWNAEGYCPIHLAVLANNVDLILALNPNPIDTNLRTRDGNTPIILALRYGCYEASEIILPHGDPYMLDNKGRSCLNILCEALRSAPADQALPYEKMAQHMLNYADSYRVDFFGPMDRVNQDIAYLTERVQAAQKRGNLEAELPAQTMMITGQEEQVMTETVPYEYEEAQYITATATTPAQPQPPASPTQFVPDPVDNAYFSKMSTAEDISTYEQTMPQQVDQPQPFPTEDGYVSLIANNQQQPVEGEYVVEGLPAEPGQSAELPQLPEFVQSGEPVESVEFVQSVEPVEEPATNMGMDPAMEAAVQALLQKREELHALRENQINAIQQLEADYSSQYEELHNRTFQKVDIYVQTPKGQETYRQAVERLCSHNISQEEACSRAYQLFIEKMMKNELEALSTRINDAKQELSINLSSTDQELVNVEDQLRSYGFN